MSAFAQSYARAVIASAPSGYDVAAFLEPAGDLARTLRENATLRAFMASPAVPLAAKTRAVQQLAEKAGLDVFGQRVFEVLLRHRRLLDASPILQALRDADDARQGVVRGRVTVAAPIGEAQRQVIEEALSGRVGGKVRLEMEVDTQILAGFVAHVGSSVFDASALAAIRRFQQEARGRTGV